MTSVDQWLSRLSGVSANIELPKGHNSSASPIIRRLRLQPEPVTCTFEKTWEADASTDSELD